MRLIDADAFKEFLAAKMKPVPSELSKEFPEIAVDDLEARWKEELQMWCDIIDRQPTVER